MSDSSSTTEVDTLRRQLAEMRAVAQDLVAHVVAEAHLTELSTRWLNDSTRWESDDYLGPQWQEIWVDNPMHHPECRAAVDAGNARERQRCRQWLKPSRYTRLRPRSPQPSAI